MSYDLNDPVPLTFQVKDASGQLANATAVTCTVTLPDGSTALPAVTNVSTGNYLATPTATVIGHYAYRFVATGVNPQAYADVFDVVDETLAIVSLADVKSHLTITSSAYDTQLIRYRDACEALAESYTGATLRRRSIVGELASGGTSAVILRSRPVQSITVASENAIVLTSGFYRLDPSPGILMRTSGYPYYPAIWLPGYLNISVDYVAGFGNAAPADLKQAILEMVRILHNEAQKGSRTTRRSPSGDEWTPSVNTLPPAIRFILDQYIQLGVA